MLNPVDNKNNMKVFEGSIKSGQSIKYFYSFDEKKINNINKIIVLVHGISRNAQEMITSYSDVVDDKTFIIAPLFSKRYAKDYQRLGRNQKGPRADYILQSIINKLTLRYGLPQIRFNLFGFSAGAQFAHRYAFAHPTHVNKVCIVAAGWYTLPSQKLHYPMGLKLQDEFIDIKFIMQRFLRVKFKIYIGDKDYERDKALNKNKLIDDLQGKTRIARAENWIEEMHEKYQKYKVNNSVAFEKLRGISHDFSMAQNLSNLCEKSNHWFNEK